MRCTPGISATYSILLQSDDVNQIYNSTIVNQLLSWSLTPVAFAAAGWATEHWGAGPAFVAGGSAAALVCLMALLHPAVRAVD